MSKILSFIVIVTVYLCTNFFVNAEPIGLLRKLAFRDDTSTPDSCTHACGSIRDAVTRCGNTTDITCGCNEWIQNTNSCSACTLVHGDSRFSSNTILNEVIRGYCLCAKDCEQIANATYTCGFHSENAACVCPSVKAEAQACTACIQNIDPHTADLVTSYFHQLCWNGSSSRFRDILISSL